MTSRPAFTSPLLRLLLAGFGCLLATFPVLAQDVSEYGMKAVLFYRLPQFIYWPGGAQQPNPTVLCVAGRNPFGNALGQIEQGRGQIEVRLGVSEITACHLLFIAGSEAANLGSWLERAHARQIVTVSDLPGFARSGGMIELPVDGERISIVVNRRVARRIGYEFSAQLLRLARVIEP